LILIISSTLQSCFDILETTRLLWDYVLSTSMCRSCIYPKCLPFGRTWVNLRFLVGFVFLNLLFSV